MVCTETHAIPIKVRLHEKVWQTWQCLISLSAKTEEDQLLEFFKDSYTGRCCFQLFSAGFLSFYALLKHFTLVFSVCECEDFRECDNSPSPAIPTKTKALLKEPLWHLWICRENVKYAVKTPNHIPFNPTLFKRTFFLQAQEQKCH